MSVTFIRPGFSFNDVEFQIYELLNQKRGPNRRITHALIVIETLRLVRGGRPTRDELQTFSKIRR